MLVSNILHFCNYTIRATPVNEVHRVDWSLDIERRWLEATVVLK